jgi:hypothetical protein
MFEHRNSGENRRKRSEIFFENLRRAYKDLIYVTKNSKLSRACVPLNITWILYHAFADGIAHDTESLPLIVHWSY